MGLSENDFDLITSYDSDCYCKPNPKYYLSICERMGVDPEDCLMIGNDEREDAYAANAAGLDTYLVTDCLIPNDEYATDCRRGTFEEMCLYLEGLAK
ncbi:MAG: HAD family hydrolase [Clostridia bacterium]|nr:HAD family hydrolase [Clostridia bacterium]